MSRRCGNALLLGLLILASACASVGTRTVPDRPAVDWLARLAEADAFAATGHYAGLREARRIYGEAVDASLGRAGVAEKFVRATIALGLREKELGILAADPDLDLDGFAASDPSLARYALLARASLRASQQDQGQPGDRPDRRKEPRRPARLGQRPCHGDRRGARTGGRDRRPRGHPPAGLADGVHLQVPRQARHEGHPRPTSGFPAGRVPGGRLSGLRARRTRSPARPAIRDSRKSIITSARPRSSAENF